MLSVQNSETWALSQANPKTKPIPPKRASLSLKPSQSFPKTEPVFPQSLWLIFPKSVTDFPKVGGTFSLNQLDIFPTREPTMLFQSFFVSNTWHCFFPKTECDLSSRSNAFAKRDISKPVESGKGCAASRGKHLLHVFWRKQVFGYITFPVPRSLAKGFLLYVFSCFLLESWTDTGRNALRRALD